MNIQMQTISKIGQMPEALVQEVNDYIDFLLWRDRHNRSTSTLSSPHKIVAPLTSRIRKSILPSHVFVPIGVANLTQDSVILCEQIRVIDKARIIRVIGHLDREYIMQLNMALCTIIGFSDDGFVQIIPDEESQ